MRLTDISLDRSSSPLAIAAVLVLGLLPLGLGNASAEEAPATDGVCFLVPLDGQTTATTGGAIALADMTVCYRALPAEFWSPSAPVLKAQATSPTAGSSPAPVDTGADAAAVAKPDPT
jgi:hypothetical protein